MVYTIMPIISCTGHVSKENCKENGNKKESHIYQKETFEIYRTYNVERTLSIIVTKEKCRLTDVTNL